MKSGGKRKIRPGAPSKVRIDYEWQDRMEEGCRRELNLILFHQPAIHRDNITHGGKLESQHLLFFLFRKAPVFRAKPG
jgi:hypothetical protein